MEGPGGPDIPTPGPTIYNRRRYNITAEGRARGPEIPTPRDPMTERRTWESNNPTIKDPRLPGNFNPGYDRDAHNSVCKMKKFDNP